MNNLNKYIENKIETMEYVVGDLTNTEKNCIRNDFFKKFLNFSIKYNYNVIDLFKDPDIYSELDELLEEDEQEAVKFVNGVI